MLACSTETEASSVSVKDLLRNRKNVEFAYEFYVERLPGFGGLKERLEIIELLVEGFENSWPWD